ncbi:MAG: glycosyltransferase family 1 protein [Magnetococcales bacterium]|nr:glycosyltransferase family 1 protein [Magnetococcales bacterium]
MRIHLLTAGFRSANGRAFLYPLLVHRPFLAHQGIHWRAFTAIEPQLFDCDQLWIDSKFHRDRWQQEHAQVLDELQRLRHQAQRLVFVDLGDNSSYLVSEVLPLVDLYCKSQLLRDRQRYLQPLYGYRPYTDFYHHRFGVTDSAPAAPIFVTEPQWLTKLHLAWNSGLSDYSATAPWRLALYRHLPITALLRWPIPITPATAPRSQPLSCRITTHYDRATVAFQRQQISQRLSHLLSHDRVSRRRYLQELARSRVVLSPFGWGEIAYRDFETFLSGALLLKPDMSHMETWPDFFIDGQTMVAFRWDLQDLEQRLEQLWSQPQYCIDLAAAGQEHYRQHLHTTTTAAELFYQQLQRIIAAAAPLNKTGTAPCPPPWPDTSPHRLS